MKYLKYFLGVGVLSTLVSFNTPSTSRLSESIYPGNLFPEMKNLGEASGIETNLSALKGQKVLVVFWAAYDDESRKEHALLSNLIKKQDESITMISLSFDKSESIYKKTLQLDGIDIKNQFLVKENSENWFDKYQLDKGFKNFLIDENGFTLAMDVKAENLNQWLSKN